METPQYKFDHIALGVNSIAETVPFIVGELGGIEYDGGHSRGFNYGFLHRFIQSRGPGIHHCTFKVPDIHAAIERVKAKGLDVVNVDTTDPNWKEAFIHPKLAHGIVIQLAQESPSAQRRVRVLKLPDVKPAPQKSVIGIHLVGKNKDEMQLLWRDILCGKEQQIGENELEYIWEESSMIVRITIDKGVQHEGPTHIELGTAQKTPEKSSGKDEETPLESSNTEKTTLLATNNELALTSSKYTKMVGFSPAHITDFKHVLYNLLVDNHNNPLTCCLVQPIVIQDEKTGEKREGFKFNPLESPEKRLPELYAYHIKKARLDWEDASTAFTQDLYRFYLRSCVELMSKYFLKVDKYTYLYDQVPLFVANESLEEAELRLRTMKSRSRMRKKRKT